MSYRMRRASSMGNGSAEASASAIASPCARALGCPDHHDEREHEAEHSADERRAGRREERRDTLQRGEGDPLQVHVGEAEHPLAALDEIDRQGQRSATVGPDDVPWVDSTQW